MTHVEILGRQLRDYLSVLFLGLFIIFTGMIYYAFGTFNLMLAGGLAALGTIFAALRAYRPIKGMYAAAREQSAEEQARFEAELQAVRDREFGIACVEIARMMSRLSKGDLSMFMTADKYCRSHAENYQFMTARGSPVHEVLVAMCDVGCVKPLEMKRLRPDVDLALATYELTDWGQHVLERFIRDAVLIRKNDPDFT